MGWASKDIQHKCMSNKPEKMAFQTKRH